MTILIYPFLFYFQKLNLFKKKALWKQIHGYQHLLKEREAEIATLRLDKHTADVVIKFISMVNEGQGIWAYFLHLK